MVILQGDHDAFKGTQQREAQDNRQWNPKHEMDHHRWVQRQFHEREERHDDETDNKDNENSRAVAAVGEAEIEAATLAPARRFQKPLEQSALATSRAPAGEAGGNR